uniref:PHD-type domain-containing protein n=1 Tax=Heliothis virescens TaxID=7102 RepID=A0A2A4JDI4_HELVI
MPKCGACGQFLSPAEAAKCMKCRSWYHRECVNIQNKTQIPPSWECPDCRKNLARDNQAETPVRGHAPPALEESLVNLMDTSPVNNTALDTTEELDIRAELRLFREEFLITVRQEFQLLREDLSGLRAALNATNDRLSNLEDRVADLESRKEVQSKQSPDVAHDTIAELRCELNDRDQELLGNDIQITNLPEVSGENPTHTAMLVASKLGIKIKARDVVSAERVGGRRIDATQAAGPTETRPRFLVVRLARRDLRDELLEGARVRRGMTTADLDMPGPPTRFYVNERLTKVNRELFRRAREAGGRLGWQYVWCKRGRILARYKPGDSACRIRCEADLLRVFGPDPVAGVNVIPTNI